MPEESPSESIKSLLIIDDEENMRHMLMGHAEEFWL